MAFAEKQVCKRHEKSTAGAGLRPEPRETVYFCVKCAEGGSPKEFLNIFLGSKIIDMIDRHIALVKATTIYL
ncbi:MAG: hypothetical protein CL559_10850 [Alphaproteobacteria bacterium]|nr:hypothetical protein [Alphaproteobacteria bacterium]